ncbi:MAG: NAD-dependent epimerase/dehydratase family protein, partial [Myxococcota bacterium]
MHIFITGGSGFVGGHAIEALIEEGHKVLALARSARSVEVVEELG